MDHEDASVLLDDVRNPESRDGDGDGVTVDVAVMLVDGVRVTVCDGVDVSVWVGLAVNVEDVV